MHQTNESLTLSEWAKRVIREALFHSDYIPWLNFLRPYYNQGLTIKQAARYVQNVS